VSWRVSRGVCAQTGPTCRRSPPGRGHTRRSRPWTLPPRDTRRPANTGAAQGRTGETVNDGVEAQRNQEVQKLYSLSRFVSMIAEHSGTTPTQRHLIGVHSHLLTHVRSVFSPSLTHTLRAERRRVGV